MRGPVLELLREEPRARLFYAAHAQSAVGTGAAYVGLVLLAYDRLHSPWAISLVLLADFLPSMLLGPLLGAAADRWSRRWAAVSADVLRAAAFVSLGLFGSFGLTIAFALLAGLGRGLFDPAVLSGLPNLVGKRRLSAGTSLYGAILDVGYTAGPAIAAGVLAITTPEALMVANGGTFALSSLALIAIPLDRRASAAEEEIGGPRTLVGAAVQGLHALTDMRPILTLILASSTVILFAGVLNVSELLLATDELGSGEAGFSALVAIYGVGVAVGSLTGSRGGPPAALKRRYLLGLIAVAAGLAGSGLAPVYPVALATFALGGVGNGLVLVHERLLIQTTVPEGFLGRVFGVRDALGSTAFGIAFLSAGAALSLTGSREVLVLAGLGTLVVWVAASLALRQAWTEGAAWQPVGVAPPPEPAGVEVDGAERRAERPPEELVATPRPSQANPLAEEGSTELDRLPARTTGNGMAWRRGLGAAATALAMVGLGALARRRRRVR